MTVTPDEIAIAWSEYLSIRDRSGAPISPAARQRRQAELNAAQAKAEALTRRWKIQTRDGETSSITGSRKNLLRAPVRLASP